MVYRAAPDRQNHVTMLYMCASLVLPRHCDPIATSRGYQAGFGSIRALPESSEKLRFTFAGAHSRRHSVTLDRFRKLHSDEVRNGRGLPSVSASESLGKTKLTHMYISQSGTLDRFRKLHLYSGVP